MKSRNETSTRKCSDRTVWMVSFRRIGLNRVDIAGDLPRPAAAQRPLHVVQGEGPC
jgi:hypothetical protein